MLIKMAIEEVRAVFSVFKDLYQYGKNIRKARAEKFTGAWTNEGSVGGSFPSHYIDLVLDVDGINVSGVISSRKLNSETNFPNQSLSGRRCGYKVKVDVTVIRHGDVSCYGELKLRLKNGQLLLKGTKLVADFLPTEAILWRHKVA